MTKYKEPYEERLKEWRQLEEWSKSFSIYKKVEQDVNDLVEEYCELFVETGYIRKKILIREDRILVDLMIEDEYEWQDAKWESRVIPISYFWDEEWTNKETEILETRQAVLKHEKEVKEAKKKFEYIEHLRARHKDKARELDEINEELMKYEQA